MTFDTPEEISLRSLVGLPAVYEGRRLGNIEQVLLTPDADRLQGMVLRRGVMPARWIPAGDVALPGEICVVLRSPPRRYTAKYKRQAAFCPAGVRDSAGLMLGWITDSRIHIVTGQVTALEVALSLGEVMLGGRYLARRWAVDPLSGQVIIPCGYALENQP